jgi:uncharacterized protein (DUF2062 family)
MKKITLIVALVAVMLMSFAPVASAGEYVANPVTGEYWYCDYYSDGYWCWVPSMGSWIHAAPGFQYGALGG